MEKMNHSYIASGYVKWYTFDIHSGKQCEGFLKTKHATTSDAIIAFLGIYSKNLRFMFIQK